MADLEYPEADGSYCKLFVDTDREQDELVRQLADTFGGTVDRHDIEFRECEVSVLANDDFDKRRRWRRREDAFLFYRYFMDIEPTAGVERSKYVGAIAAFLRFFWSEGISAVAAADFEDELPVRPGSEGQ